MLLLEKMPGGGGGGGGRRVVLYDQKMKEVSPLQSPISAPKSDLFCDLITPSLRKRRNAVVLIMIHGTWFNSMTTSIPVSERTGEIVWGS